jgi:bifunctional N-acetylglucosamine-1-phosphate-uridyltransferase/glucosamine-1-phosphate-acetyltransferase GlmU-like protein
MKSDVPKVMHEICGQPMLAYVLDACRQAGIEQFYVVVGFGKETVTSAFGAEPGVSFVEQTEQKGTGHAVLMCRDALAGFNGDCVVIAGDMPMIRAETLRSLIGGHRAAGATASLATTVLEDPTSYGRILRDEGGGFAGIVEHRDCTPGQ